MAQDARNPDGGREGCEGEPEYSQGSRLEEEGVTCEGTHETPEIAKQDVNVRDITGRDGARPPGESGDWGTPATVGGLEVASGDHGTQMRTHPLASCSQPEMVIGCEELLSNPPNQEGTSCVVCVCVCLCLCVCVCVCALNPYVGSWVGKQ